MNNKTIAVCLAASFLLLFVAEYTGDFADTLYSVGALGSLFFSVLAIRELNNRNKKAWFPYVYIFITAVFWAAAFVDSEVISSLGLVYLAAGLMAVIELLKKSGGDTLKPSSASLTMSERFSVLNRALKPAFAVGILIAGLSIAYYLVFFLPQKEKTLESKQAIIQEQMKECFDQADQEFYLSWESICKEEEEEGRCSSIMGYPVYIQIQGIKDDAKKRCTQLYNL